MGKPGYRLPCSIEQQIISDGAYVDHSNFPVEGVKSMASQHVLSRLDETFSLMGIPKVLKSNNRPLFQGHEFCQFCKQYRFSYRKITPLWPQANGQVENFMKDLNKVIQRSFVSGVDWRTKLNSFLRAYRNTPHGSSKNAPSNLLFIRSNHSKMPLPVESHSSSESREKARENDMVRKATMKAYAEKRRLADINQFQIGDKVVLDQHAGRSIFNKYESKFTDKLPKVKSIKGSMVTIQERNRKFITWNCSLFKKAPLFTLRETEEN